MESQNHSIRFIIADQEDLVTWTGELEKASILEVLVYIKNQLRKKYNTESLVFSDIDSTEYTLEKIADQEQTPVFVTLPQRPEIQTAVDDVQPRNHQIMYNFKEAGKVKVQKFENLKKYEEVDLSLSVMKTLNDASNKRNFEKEAKIAQDKQKLLAANGPNGQPNGANGIMGKIAQAFGGKSEEKMITPEDLANDDMSKRQKVPLSRMHGNDGQSQWSFMNLVKPKQAEPQKTSAGGMQSYTMDDVKKHNRREDAWMVLNNKVYDVTDYIPFHPGGAKILAGIGRDATEIYNKYHPWVNAEFMLAKYQVGYLKR